MALRGYVLPLAGGGADLEERLAEARDGTDGATCLREADVEDMEVVLHPSRSGDVALGIQEHLNSLLLRYNEEHGGVVLGYRSARVHGTRAPLVRGLSPHLRIRLSCQLLLFSPRPGDMLRGTVNCVGADFVGLLVLGLFNVAVSDQHLSSFKFLPAKSLWKHRSNAKHRVKQGSEVQAQVVSVQDSGHMLDIRASLDAPGTGCLPLLADGA